MLSLDNILLPVDFSPRSEGAARCAQVLASQFHSRIILLHIEHEPFLVGNEELKGPPMGSIEHTCWLRKRLESFLSGELQGPSVTRVVIKGDPAPNIVELASVEKADLIVMPAHGHRPFRELLWGSVVAKVLHDSCCPVWTGVHLANIASTHSLFFHRIACAIDLGPHTLNALAWASEFASAFGAPLLVIHIIKPVTAAGVNGSAGESQLDAVSRARGEIEHLLGKLGIIAEIAVGAGSASKVIYDLALGFAADLLVIGRHELPIRLHADTFTLIRKSHCPVVSV
jgi:nucleotide-binding universal stress UspA family protein